MHATRAVALIAGLTLLAAPAFAAGKAKSPSATGEDRAAAEGHRPFDRLHLTDAQRAQLRDKGFEAEHKAVELHARLADARITLRQLMTADNLDEGAVRTAAATLADVQGQVTKARIERRLAMLSVLTPEQRRQMHEMRGRGFMGGGRRGMGHGMMGPGGRRGRAGRGNGERTGDLENGQGGDQPGDPMGLMGEPGEGPDGGPMGPGPEGPPGGGRGPDGPDGGGRGPGASPDGALTP